MNGKDPGDGVVKVFEGDELLVFADGFDEPKGICFVGDYLVTTDLKTVWKVDREGNKTLLAGSDDFPCEIRYLNDAATVTGEDAVYIVDMGDRSNLSDENGEFHQLDSEAARTIAKVGRVFKIGLDGRVSIVVDVSPKMPCPNGMSVANDGSILTTSFFRGELFKVEGANLRSLASGMRGADGVEQSDEGSYYVSSWKEGTLWRVNGNTGDTTVMLEGLESAADFYLDEMNKRILIPNMHAGVVVEVGLY